ncbi:MAG: arginine deiminase family protein [Desulfobacula sp.]|nr:arginine deiminase family protein [Desulfobacula sp.]
MFTQAIVKTPCKSMVNGITQAGLGTPDYELALVQHKAYIKALETCGLKVTILAPDDNFPDSTFIEDACLITPRCAILTRPGANSRRKEPFHISKAIHKLDLPVETIRSPGTIDAGDIMMVGDHYYIGLSDRTSTNGAEQMIEILNKYGLTGSTIELKTMLHLKTGISYLENNTLLAFGEFLQKKELQKFNILRVDDNESYAANSVWINDIVIVPDGFSRTAEMISKKKYEIIAVDVSEFRKLDGGLSCLSLRF